MNFLNSLLPKVIDKYNDLDDKMKRLVRWFMRFAILAMFAFALNTILIAWSQLNSTKAVTYKRVYIDTCVNKTTSTIHDTVRLLVKNEKTNSSNLSTLPVNIKVENSAHSDVITGNGNTVDKSVHIGNVQRHITTRYAAFLISSIENIINNNNLQHDVKITLGYPLGNGEAAAFIEEIAHFLQSNGYIVNNHIGASTNIDFKIMRSDDGIFIDCGARNPYQD
jgi:hypothetical protein